MKRLLARSVVHTTAPNAPNDETGGWIIDLARAGRQGFRCATRNNQ
jgi:hypothetical protein